jgi:hypothetical protein
MWNLCKILFGSIAICLLAIFLFLILCPLGLLWALGASIIKRIPKEFIIYFANIFFNIGFALDKIGCVVLAPYMNRFFIQDHSKYKFGSIKHTISLVIAYNYRENTLKRHGRWLYNTLEFVDPGHCELAIKDFENINFKNNKYNI